jgi:hypothetical protein
MYNFKIKTLITLFAIFLIIGCGGSSGSSNIEKRPQLNENNIVSIATQEMELTENQFSDGVVIENVIITAQTDGIDTVTATISEETEFVNDKGEAITAPPVVALVQQESTEEIVKEGKVTTKNVVKAELKLVDKDGNKIIPSKPMEIVMKAPSGTKPGDKVRVEIPDGATASKKTVQEKLIIVVVGADGNIHITILPEVFKKLTVIVIIVERSLPPVPITGGTGGN